MIKEVTLWFFNSHHPSPTKGKNSLWFVPALPIEPLLMATFIAQAVSVACELLSAFTLQSLEDCQD